MFYVRCSLFKTMSSQQQAINDGNKEVAEELIRRMQVWEYEEMVEGLRRLGITVNGMCVRI